MAKILKNKSESIWKILSDSSQLMFSSYKIFIPSLLMIIFGLLIAAIPAYGNFLMSLATGGDFSASTIISLIILYLVIITISVLITSWQLSILRRAVQDHSFRLASSFKEILNYFLVLISTGLILLLTMIIVAVPIWLISLGLFALSKILGALFIIIMIIALLFFIPYPLRLIGVVALEKKGPVQSIVLAWNIFLKRYGESWKMIGVTILISIPYYIAYLIFSKIVIGDNVLFALEHPFRYQLMFLPISVISTLISLLLIIFYLEVYEKRF